MKYKVNDYFNTKHTFFKFDESLAILNPAEEYIFNQPEPYKSMLLHLQVLVEHTLPEADLKYKWKIPCYYLDKTPLCYFNASHKKEYVDVGFWHSAYLDKFDEYLNSEGRTVVKSLRYTSLNDIDDDIFIQIIKSAAQHKGKSFYKRS